MASRTLHTMHFFYRIAPRPEYPHSRGSSGLMCMRGRGKCCWWSFPPLPSASCFGKHDHKIFIEYCENSSFFHKRITTLFLFCLKLIHCRMDWSPRDLAGLVLNSLDTDSVTQSAGICSGSTERSRESQADWFLSQLNSRASACKKKFFA